MSYEFDGITIEANEAGYLKFTSDWNAELAELIANSEGIELTQKHWDIIQYIRIEYFGSQGLYPLVRSMKSAMEKQWQQKVSHKDLYALFPGSPSKQGIRIAGLPETV
ncbi:MAG: TusE/DsrC/DsvC family sulfur relay protein [Granulosicoccaceae bacterium]